MVFTDDYADYSLEEIIREYNLGDDLYSDICMYAKMALFSQWPERRIYAQRKLDSMGEIHIALAALRDKGEERIYMSFGGRRPAFYVTSYPASRVALEDVPSSHEMILLRLLSHVAGPL